ncbi:hypothetical protein L202_07962 [Cryptococcus amylolentus CBS 6039]|uniref:Uncharacterized protein n=1 Tax=Cryptococcus amylolentus CBS 6039 TaxID=1295533 RepID=A0A1E3HAU0_9TREE|nr:hypothetical protein L202_07962 [Cryptococcus amylolentus CBS 6039]ODN73443.1 hypothetical protein L202_07962 [Cryptococcus amylolentus CBS 6039]
MSLDFEKIHTPKTLSHEFELQPLADTLAAKPLSAAACKLIDMPKNEFLDTEEEINVIEAALYILSVKFDTLPQEERPNDRDKVRLVSGSYGNSTVAERAQWITRNRGPVMEQLISRVEPPFRE